MALVKKAGLKYPLIIKRDDLSNTLEQLLNHLMIKVPDEEILRKVFAQKLHDIE